LPASAGLTHQFAASRQGDHKLHRRDLRYPPAVQLGRHGFMQASSLARWLEGM